METKTITIDVTKVSKEDLVLLYEIIKRSEGKSIWKPQEREKYYFVIDAAIIESDKWSNHEVDSVRWSIGNIFKTPEDAEFAIEKLKVTTELKRYAEQYNDKIDWKDGNSIKYCLLYNHAREEIAIVSFYTFQHNGIHFSSTGIAENAIKEIGEERIKKYYLEVEE